MYAQHQRVSHSDKNYANNEKFGSREEALDYVEACDCSAIQSIA